MLSHDLARELLARRNNDVRVQVLLDNGTEEEFWRTSLIELRPDDKTLDDETRADPVVGYDAFNDVIVIRAGVIVARLGGED